MNNIILIKGVEGLAVYINDRRVCGPKPWGGGGVVGEWGNLKDEDILPSLLQRAEAAEATASRQAQEIGELKRLLTEWVETVQIVDPGVYGCMMQKTVEVVPEAAEFLKPGLAS